MPAPIDRESPEYAVKVLKSIRANMNSKLAIFEIRPEYAEVQKKFQGIFNQFGEIIAEVQKINDEIRQRDWMNQSHSMYKTKNY